MADIEITREHGREPDRVREYADEMLGNQERVQAVEWSEDGEVAEITGQGFSGTLRIDEDTVTGRIELSMMARPFRDAIEEQLTRYLDDMLECS